MLADAEQFGIPLEAFEKMLEKDYDFEVFEDNWPSLLLFLQMRTQWVTHPFGGLRGLDYTALNSVMQMLNVEDTGAAFNDLQIMEAAALTVFAEKQERESNGPKKFSNKLHDSNGRRRRK